MNRRFSHPRRDRCKITRQNNSWSIVAALAAISCAPAQAATVTLTPAQDTSIYSEYSGNSNGKGDLFAGVTNYANVRRALVQFDIAGTIPTGAIINSVSLTLTLTRVNVPGSANFTLNPLLAGWGEGSSFGTGEGGAATPGEATWSYNSFNTNLWIDEGGTFGPASGTASIGITTGTSYTFASGTGMVTAVQEWADHPSTNFGWILMAEDEYAGGTSARSFGSSESATPSDRPTLTVTYTIPEPSSTALFLLGMSAFIAIRRTPASKNESPVFLTKR